MMHCSFRVGQCLPIGSVGVSTISLGIVAVKMTVGSRSGFMVMAVIVAVVMGWGCRGGSGAGAGGGGRMIMVVVMVVASSLVQGSTFRAGQCVPDRKGTLGLGHGWSGDQQEHGGHSGESTEERQLHG
ncbi:hypothetical protein B0O80DRAFT_215485 [Mortierella sp. GBAus27b]|nr:hypothetical protein B0O80DRAFT_215485 [Mortierella sp. GBAus27b]